MGARPAWRFCSDLGKKQRAPDEGHAGRKSGGEGCGKSHRTQPGSRQALAERQAQMTQRFLSPTEQMG